MVYPIRIIGVGPGHEDYITPAAKKAAETADLLVGSQRSLKHFLYLKKEIFIIGRDMPGLVRKIKEFQTNKRVAVLVTGDPGFYSLASYLKKHFSRAQLELMPGISSTQVAFARIGRSWENVQFISVHGRPLNKLLPVIENYGTVAVLTDNLNTPKVVADYLKGKIEGDPLVFICDSLTDPAEEIFETRLSQVYQDTKNSVMVIAYE